MSDHRRAAPDQVGFAVATIIFTVLALSLGDALIKQVSADFVLWQIFVVRSLIAMPVLAAIMKARYGAISLKPDHIGWTALRSLMLTLMWVAYYAALPHLALSVAAAAYYTLPIFITLFAALFIGDRVGVQGWVAIALGFGGVLLILKPGADDFNAYALLPLLSAVLYALAMILTRTKCRTENPAVLSVSLNLSFVIVGAAATMMIAAFGPADPERAGDAFLLGPWAPMGANEWLAMGLLAAAIIIGSVGAAIAYQAGPPSVIATFDFSYIAFAVVWGAVFFGEIPGTVTLVGILLVVTAGIIAVRR